MLRQLRPVAEAQAIAASAATTSSLTSKFSTRMLRTRVGMSASTCSSAIAPRRSCLQAAVDGLEQVVGLVLLDLEVGVADDAEQVRALDLRAGEQLLDVGADHVLEEDERRDRLAG